MLLFSVVINQTIVELAKSHKVAAYADDILIGHNPNIDKNVIISQVKDMLAKYGLMVSERKCRST